MTKWDRRVPQEQPRAAGQPRHVFFFFCSTCTLLAYHITPHHHTTPRRRMGPENHFSGPCFFLFLFFACHIITIPHDDDEWCPRHVSRAPDSFFHFSGCHVTIPRNTPLQPPLSILVATSLSRQLCTTTKGA